MLSSLQALAGATPASRSASAFQPKFKPRAARPRASQASSPAAEENVASTPQDPAAQELPATPPAAPASTPRPAAAPVSSPATPSPRVDARRQEHIPRPRADVSTAPRVSSPAPDPSPPVQRPGKEPVNHFSAPSPQSPSNPAISEAETGESSRKRKRVSSNSAPRRRRVENVDEAIDPVKMTFRDIIRLADAKDRKKQKEVAVKKQERAAEERPETREKDQANPPALQVRIVDGNIVVDEESMKVDARALNSDDLGSYRRIEESSSKLNYHSHMVRVPRDRWKPEETETFYKAVQQFGTDFAVIERLFPGKSRRQIKNKYKKEERSNPRRLTDSILKQRPGDLAHYEELVEKLRASAAEKAGVDEFAFTWDVNANANANKEGSEAAEGGVEEEAGEEAFENDSTAAGAFDEIDDATYNDMESSSPKKEEQQRSSVEFEPPSAEKMESKDDEFVAPPLFAYEMEF